MDYEVEFEKARGKNSKYIKEFEKWLKAKGLASKTIKNHIDNVDLYINDYLNRYEIGKMEDGCCRIDGFLGDWFIRKCMWSTAYSIKTTAASIKKFYLCMSELGYVNRDDYKFLCNEIKDGMDDWIEEVEEYNSGDFDYFDVF